MVGEGRGVTGLSVKCLRIYSIFMPLGSHWFAPANAVLLYEYGLTILPSDGS